MGWKRRLEPWRSDLPLTLQARWAETAEDRRRRREGNSDDPREREGLRDSLRSNRHRPYGAPSAGMSGSSAVLAPPKAVLPYQRYVHQIKPDGWERLLCPTFPDLPPVEERSNVYVFGLPSKVDDLFLYKLYAQFGSIVSTRVQLDLKNETEAGAVSKGYGFVQFRYAQDADLAVAYTRGMELDGRTLQVNIHGDNIYGVSENIVKDGGAPVEVPRQGSALPPPVPHLSHAPQQQGPPQPPVAHQPQPHAPQQHSPFAPPQPHNTPPQYQQQQYQRGPSPFAHAQPRPPRSGAGWQPPSMGQTATPPWANAT
eukprot:TRINITY_DN58368_c0_g1_i1.p1 TRINITY_DN58368_c0_g1~~TRINITY_DN58368_c0_g1_i1.p1  ORF type:complete len:312 (+),score=23.93 TRINITY_DN58368_c0_g1_i1:255-1190(+)